MTLPRHEDPSSISGTNILVYIILILGEIRATMTGTRREDWPSSLGSFPSIGLRYCRKKNRNNHTPHTHTLNFQTKKNKIKIKKL